jgi:S1-C subfamily serine protease
VGFAIPAAVARQVIETAASGGHEVVRPWLGAKTQALTPEMAKSLGLASVRGVVVTDVWPSGPAARAGVARGDVIQSVDGDVIDDDRALTFAVGAHRPGDAVTLTVARGATPRPLRLTVDAPPPSPTSRPPRPIAAASILSPPTAWW